MEAVQKAINEHVACVSTGRSGANLMLGNKFPVIRLLDMRIGDLFRYEPTNVCDAYVLHDSVPMQGYNSDYPRFDTFPGAIIYSGCKARPIDGFENVKITPFCMCKELTDIIAKSHSRIPFNIDNYCYLVKFRKWM